MTRWESILGQDEKQQEKRRNSSWLDKHGRDQRSLALRGFMNANGLSPEDVAMLLRRSSSTVKYWLVGGRHNMPASSMSLLRMKIAARNLEQEIINYQKK